MYQLAVQDDLPPPSVSELVAAAWKTNSIRRALAQMSRVWTTRMSQPSKAAASINLSRSNSLEDVVPASGSSHHSQGHSLERAFQDSVVLLSSSRGATAKSISIPAAAGRGPSGRVMSADNTSDLTATPSTETKSADLGEPDEGIKSVTRLAASVGTVDPDLGLGISNDEAATSTSASVPATSAEGVCNGRQRRICAPEVLKTPSDAAESAKDLGTKGAGPPADLLASQQVSLCSSLLADFEL